MPASCRRPRSYVLTVCVLLAACSGSTPSGSLSAEARAGVVSICPAERLADCLSYAAASPYGASERGVQCALRECCGLNLLANVVSAWQGGACNVDSDCRIEAPGVRCASGSHSGCGIGAIAESTRASYEAERDTANARICAAFPQAACNGGASCARRSVAVCQSGRCVLSDGGTAGGVDGGLPADGGPGDGGLRGQ